MKRIYECMNTGKPFKEMSDEELKSEMVEMVQGICIMTGCAIEAGLAVPTMSMMKLFFLKNYGFLTKPEVIYAFEYNSQLPKDEHISHYNRTLNIDFVGQVMNAYLEHRREQMPEIINVNRYVERLDSMGERNVDDKVTDEDRKVMLETAYHKYLIDGDEELYCVDVLYDYAEKFELIIPGIYGAVCDVAGKRLIGRYSNELASLGQRRATFGRADELEKKIASLKVPWPEYKNQPDVVTEAKRICLVRKFNEKKEQNKSSLWS